MKKLNNSEIDKVSGGHDLQIQKSDGKFNVIQTVNSFDSEEEAKNFIYDNALENIQHKRGHGHPGHPPFGPSGNKKHSGICNMPNPFAGKPDQK